MFYYRVWDRINKCYYIECAALDPYLMTSDYLLFDSAEDCEKYWKENDAIDELALCEQIQRDYEKRIQAEEKLWQAGEE